MMNALVSNWQAIISGIIGFLSGLFWLKTQLKKYENESVVKLREDLFRQISMQDQRIAAVEKALEKWRTRYWKLYSHHVSIIAKHKLTDLPPNFHDDDSIV